MSNLLNQLQPQELWKNFSAINAIPRASKKEERIIEFMIEFGKSLALPTLRDEVGNVIIKKPASAGMENRKTVVLQSHLDMVHQKNADTNFDFNSQGIEMYIDQDWVKAKGTTLGADNGIGVAAIMAVLASNTIAHPPIEALFTIDEETGMTGALNLKGALLDGRILLNLDTEDDNELTIGCAGGIDVTASGTFVPQDANADTKSFQVIVKGLTGGHSGMDIYLGRGNANKIMNRVLSDAAEKFGIQISTIDGGSLRNAIPRESTAIIYVNQKQEKSFINFIADLSQIIKQELRTTDPAFELSCVQAIGNGKVLPEQFQHKLQRGIYACVNGVYRMSPDILHLVQTSNNLARVLVKDTEFSIQCLTRSAVDSEKMDLAQSLKSAFELFDAKVDYKGSYPGWSPNPDAAIVKLMTSVYRELYHEMPNVNACHAGLECGILGTNYPGMEMISFGPNIKGAHSPDEKVQISSVQKFWNFFLETLKRIPSNNQ